MEINFKLPAHPLIRVHAPTVAILADIGRESVLTLTDDEAITLGLALMETGLHIKKQRKDAQQAKSQPQTTEDKNEH